MLIAIHQPNFLPWCGYFYKMAKADLFVVYDDAQFTRGSYINRCKINSPAGERWLSVPVITSGRHLQKICETETAKSPWAKHLIGSLRDYYRNTPYFDLYIQKLQTILEQGHNRLLDLNLSLLHLLREELQIDTPLVLSSRCQAAQGASTERLISICECLGATSYLSGSGGKKYQDEELFRSAGISLEYSDFHHPEYLQPGGDFRPNLSAIDLLFNQGPASANHFRLAKVVRPSA